MKSQNGANFTTMIKRMQEQLVQTVRCVKNQSERIEKVTDSLHRSIYCSKIINNQINDLLDFAKLEKNKF